MEKHSRESLWLFGQAAIWLLATGLLLLAISFFIPKAGAAEISQTEFPITANAPHVWEWQFIKEDTPSGESDDFFIIRYFKAPEEEILRGTVGLTVSLRDVPELGVLYQIWNIKLEPNGDYNFSSAVYAHRLNDNQWFVAPTGFIIKAGLKSPTDMVSVIVYRRMFGSKLGEREKVVVEYRMYYTRLVIRSVVFKILDPTDDRVKPIYFELKLSNTPVGEKVIEKQRRLK